MLGARLFKTTLLVGCFLLPHQTAVGDCCIYEDDFDWVLPEDPYSEQFLTEPDGTEWYCHYDSEEDEEANADNDSDRITNSGDGDDDGGDSYLDRSESAHPWNEDPDDEEDSSDQCRFGQC